MQIDTPKTHCFVELKLIYFYWRSEFSLIATKTKRNCQRLKLTVIMSLQSLSLSSSFQCDHHHHDHDDHQHCCIRFVRSLSFGHRIFFKKERLLNTTIADVL